MLRPARHIPRHVLINGKAVALVARTASSSLALHSALQRDPPICVNRVPISADDPDVLSRFWHTSALAVENPRSSALLVRHPVRRFESALGWLGLTFDQALQELRTDYHFVPVVEYTTRETACFRFPDHLPQFCEHMGLKTLLKTNNKLGDGRPALTMQQESQVIRLFQHDMALWEALPAPEIIQCPSH